MTVGPVLDTVYVDQGVPVDRIPPGGVVAAQHGGRPVLLYHGPEGVCAVSATCTHLGAPLAEGLVVDGTVRCPWHHACFDLTTGEATRSPAFQPLNRYRVETREGRAHIVDEMPVAAPAVQRGSAGPEIVIVGGGAAAYAAAHEIRRSGSAVPITMVSDDVEPPYDRTLLTKDYLDGRFDDSRLPVSERTVGALGVTLKLRARVEAINVAERLLRMADGSTLSYGKLLLATGAKPIPLDVPGSDLPHVRQLRSAEDGRAILARLAGSRRVVLVGSSFIGLEAAASLRDRGLEVHVVSPDTRPMAKVFGPDLADLILAVHRGHGTVFHLGRKPAEIRSDTVVLDDGTVLQADLVVVGIGVRPRTELAVAAALEVDDGVIVDSLLRTSGPDIYAAGDIASWPDPHSGKRLRVEHWTVAQRQGQAAARSMLGHVEPFDAVPFFWTKQFELGIRYVGHADEWDEIVVAGDVAARDAAVRFRRAGRDLALATVNRDLDSLRMEHALESLLEGSSPRPPS